MATYIVLAKFTDQGMRNLKEFPARAKENMQRAEAQGLTMKGAYVTQGEYDQVLIFDAPNEQSATAALLTLGMQGNLHTSTMRAYTVEEIEAIISKLP